MLGCAGVNTAELLQEILTGSFGKFEQHMPNVCVAIMLAFFMTPVSQRQPSKTFSICSKSAELQLTKVLLTLLCRQELQASFVQKTCCDCSPMC